VIAAEDERDHPAVGGVPDLLCDALARLPDLRKKAGVSIAGVDRLPDVREDIPPILRGDPERLEPLAETGVADRRRPHVDPAPARAQVELGADDRHACVSRHRAILTRV